MSMESKTHSYNNITYNNLELTVKWFKVFDAKSNLEQHNLRLWMSRLAYHTDKCSFTTKKKITRKRKRDREKEKGRERKGRKRHTEREDREWERLDGTVWFQCTEKIVQKSYKTWMKNHVTIP